MGLLAEEEVETRHRADEPSISNTKPHTVEVGHLDLHGPDLKRFRLGRHL